MGRNLSHVLRTASTAGLLFVALIACVTPTVTASPSPTVRPTQTPAATTAAPTTAAPTATTAVTAASPTPTAAATTATPTTAATATPVRTATPTPTPVPTATPVPTPTPTPTPVGTPAPNFTGRVEPNATGAVPTGFARQSARVTDATSGLPVVGACAYTGPPAGCPAGNANRSDSNGYFAIDLPTGATFSWTVEHPAYNAAIGVRITVANQSIVLTRKP